MGTGVRVGEEDAGLIDEVDERGEGVAGLKFGFLLWSEGGG